MFYTPSNTAHCCTEKECFKHPVVQGVLTLDTETSLTRANAVLQFWLSQGMVQYLLLTTAVCAIG